MTIFPMRFFKELDKSRQATSIGIEVIVRDLDMLVYEVCDPARFIVPAELHGEINTFLQRTMKDLDVFVEKLNALRKERRRAKTAERKRREEKDRRRSEPSSN